MIQAILNKFPLNKKFWNQVPYVDVCKNCQQENAIKQREKKYNRMIRQKADNIKYKRAEHGNPKQDMINDP